MNREVPKHKEAEMKDYFSLELDSMVRQLETGRTTLKKMSCRYKTGNSSIKVNKGVKKTISELIDDEQKKEWCRWVRKPLIRHIEIRRRCPHCDNDHTPRELRLPWCQSTVKKMLEMVPQKGDYIIIHHLMP